MSYRPGTATFDRTAFADTYHESARLMYSSTSPSKKSRCLCATLRLRLESEMTAGATSLERLPDRGQTKK
jgi:hypothetical protein